MSVLQNVAAGLERHLDTGGAYHGSVSRGTTFHLYGVDSVMDTCFI